MNKKLILLTTIFILAVCSTFAQNTLDPQPLTFDSTQWANNIAETQDNFARGWNWGSIGSRLDSAMGFRYWHNGPDSANNPMLWINNQRRIVAIGHEVTRGHMNETLLNSQAFVFKPALTVNSSGTHDTLAHDPYNNVFGFLTHNASASIDASSRYVLDKNLYGPQTEVLSGLWPNNHFWLYDYFLRNSIEIKNGFPDTTRIGFDNETGYDSLNGKVWYVDINLRSLEVIPNNLLDTRVLSISMKYYFANGDSALVKFDSVPNQNLTAIMNINDSRGVFRTTTKRPIVIPGGQSRTDFNITGAMLKTDTLGTPNRDINLRASFTCDGVDAPNYRNNPWLQPEDWQSPKDTDGTRFITKMDLIVTYYGGLNLALNYIKINTPQGQNLLNGKYDSRIQAAAQEAINNIQGNGRDIRIFRFYAIDEPLVSLWHAQRYYNKLLHGLAITEGEMYYNKLYENHLELKENWRGSTVQGFYNNVAAPYIKETNRKMNCNDANNASTLYEVFNYSNGYKGFFTKESGHTDFRHSEYETFLIRQTGTPTVCQPYNYWTLAHQPWPINKTVFDNTKYSNDFYLVQSVQANIENELLNKYIKQPSFLYSSSPWFANVWIDSKWFWQNSGTGQFGSMRNDERPKTGEEVKYMSGINIILGSKGYFVWIGKSELADWADYNPPRLDRQNVMGLAAFPWGSDSLRLDTLTDEEMINSEDIGGDYIRFPVDASGLTAHLSSSDASYNFTAMGGNHNTIYMGRRSIRRVFKDLNTYLDHVGPELMKLKFVSWLDKGFTKSTVTDPKFDSTILSKIIDVNNIKTRPFGRIRSVTDTLPYFEQNYVDADGVNKYLDSGFYDITILRDTVDTNMEQSFTLAVMNRRTDPFFFEDGN